MMPFLFKCLLTALRGKQLANWCTVNNINDSMFLKPQQLFIASSGFGVEPSGKVKIMWIVDKLS